MSAYNETHIKRYETRADTKWLTLAACVGEDPTMFDHENKHRHGDAALICNTCPVRADCLADALADPNAWGIRAGQLIEAGKRKP